MSTLPPALEQLLQRHIAAENAHDMQATLDTLHPECLFQDIALGETYRGRDGANTYYRTWWDAFDLRFRRGDEGRRYFTDQGTVVSEGVFYGRHQGTFRNVPATGRDVEFRFVVFVDFRDGLMNGERFYYDAATLWRQIGAA